MADLIEGTFFQIPYETLLEWRKKLESISIPIVEYDSNIENMKNAVIDNAIKNADDIIEQLDEIIR